MSDLSTRVSLAKTADELQLALDSSCYKYIHYCNELTHAGMGFTSSTRLDVWYCGRLNTCGVSITGFSMDLLDRFPKILAYNGVRYRGQVQTGHLAILSKFEPVVVINNPTCNTIA